MSVIHLRNIDSDVAAGTLWSYQLSRDSGPETDVEIIVPGNSTLIGYGFSDAVGAGAQPKSTCSVNFEAVQGSGDISFNVVLDRVSALGAVLQTAATGSSVTFWPGWWVTSFTSLDFGTWGATDRLRVSYRFVNNSSQSRTISLRMNGESSQVTIPWVPVDRWGGVGIIKRIRAGVGGEGGPLGITTEPNTYSGQTDWNMAPLFYSPDYGVNWELGEDRGRSNDSYIAQIWKGLVARGNRGEPKVDPTAGPTFYGVGYDPRYDPENDSYGATAYSPHRSYLNTSVYGKDWEVRSDFYISRRYSSFHSTETGYGWSGLDQYGLGLAIGSSIGVSIAYGLTPDIAVMVLSGTTDYLTKSTGGSGSPADGTWTIQSRSGSQWTCVTYSPELTLFVVGASDGSIYTSPDGLTWTQQTPPESVAGNSRTAAFWLPSKTFLAGAAGRDVTETRPGRFVMFGTSSIIFSEDGINWSTPRFAPSRNFRALAYSRELDILWAGGRDGYTAISLDFGDSWYAWGRVPQAVDDPFMGGSVYKVHPESGIHVTGMAWHPDASTLYVKGGPRPPDLEVLSKTQTSINLGWNEITGATYDLRRSQVVQKIGEYTWTSILTASALLSFDDTGLAGGSLYAYSIRANTAEVGEWSEPFLVSTDLTANAPVAAPTLYLIKPPAKRLLWNYESGVSPPAQDQGAITLLEELGYSVDTVTDADLPVLGVEGGSPGGSLVNYDGVFIRTDGLTVSSNSDYGAHPAKEPDGGTGWVGLVELADLVRMMSLDRNTSRALGIGSDSFPVWSNTVHRVDGLQVSDRFPPSLEVLTGTGRIHRMGLGLSNVPLFTVQGTGYERTGGAVVVQESGFGIAVARAHYGVYQSDLWTSIGEQLFAHTVEYWLRS